MPSDGSSTMLCYDEDAYINDDADLRGDDDHGDVHDDDGDDDMILLVMVMVMRMMITMMMKARGRRRELEECAGVRRSIRCRLVDVRGARAQWFMTMLTMTSGNALRLEESRDGRRIPVPRVAII